jgi:hypothetical protein
VHPHASTIAFRAGAALLAAGCIAVLAAAASITPSTCGMGTHTQLGLPQCGWVLMFGRPCMTCGMTTAFAHMVRLEVWSSVRAQPLGALLAMLTPILMFAGLHAAIWGTRIDALAAPLLRPRSLWVGAALLVGAWVYKLIVTA